MAQVSVQDASPFVHFACKVLGVSATLRSSWGLDSVFFAAAAEVELLGSHFVFFFMLASSCLLFVLVTGD